MKKLEYHNDKTGIALSLVDSIDLPRIEIYSRVPEGLTEGIRRSLRAVYNRSVPDTMGIFFRNPSARQADAIQQTYDSRPEEESQIEVRERDDGLSNNIKFMRKVPLEKILKLIETEYGSLANILSCMIYWGGDYLKPLPDATDIFLYFDTRHNDKMGSIRRPELKEEVKRRGFDDFGHVCLVEPRSHNLLFLDIAREVAPIMAPNDRDYAICIHDMVSGCGLIFKPSEFNSMNTEEVMKHYKYLILGD